ncbi:hypothetical protein HDU76_003718 [Blyttiomyces sp. JEL0837]|nr:hypothetical protein HDU76_003718 [Blyttiomyces sp. JEL0837]
MMECRTAFHGHGQDADELLDIFFEADFSFAFTGTVLRGLQKDDEELRNLTLEVLETMLAIEARAMEKPSKYVSDKCIGYVAPMLPFYPHEMKALFTLSGIEADLLSTIENNADSGSIYALLSPPADEARCLLTITLLASILEIVDGEEEMSTIFGVISEVALDNAPSVSFIYESLLPRMNSILTTTQPETLTRPVHALFQTMMAIAPQSAPSAPTLARNKNRRESTSSALSSCTDSSQVNIDNTKTTLRRSNSSASAVSNSSTNLASLIVPAGSSALYFRSDRMGFQNWSPLAEYNIPRRSSSDSNGRVTPTTSTITNISRTAMTTPPQQCESNLKASSDSVIELESNDGTEGSVIDPSLEGHLPHADTTDGVERIHDTPLCTNEPLLARLAEIGFQGLPFANCFSVPNADEEYLSRVQIAAAVSAQVAAVVNFIQEAFGIQSLLTGGLPQRKSAVSDQRDEERVI